METNIKLKQQIRILVLFVMFLFLLKGNILASNSKSYDLRTKMDGISLLREKVMERQSQASKLCEQLKERVIELKKEIKGERRRLKITSFQDAMRSPRIGYNIKLIRKILAYISRLNDKIQYLNIANEELMFVCQQADDDLKILYTLNDMKIEELLGQMNQISHKYQSEANKLMIDSDNFALPPSEEIWNSIMN